MLTLRGVVIFVLSLSFLIFVALFGRLPALRGTPISFLYRILWIKIPRILRRMDSALTGGSGGRAANEFWGYLLYKNHPFVMIIFIIILTGSATLFLSATYLILSTSRLISLLTLIAFPYLLTYLCASSTASIITSSTSPHQHTYPHDHIIFHPHNICRTCKIPKPARSKHCSLCGCCVARMDHHCHWITNCVGHANYISFLLLLLSLNVLLVYGAYLAHGIISDRLQLDLAGKEHHDPRNSHLTSSPVAEDASSSSSVSSSYSVINALTSFISPRLRTFNRGLQLGGLRIGGVGLLCTLTAPLPAFMFGYHMYLLWAGMTTNESDKWEQLREDMRDGLVYRGLLREQHSNRSHTGDVEGCNDKINNYRYDSHNGYRANDNNINNNNNYSFNNADKDEQPKWPHQSRYMLLTIVPDHDHHQHGDPNTYPVIPVLTSTSTSTSTSTQPPTQTATALPQHIANSLSDTVDPTSWQRVWHLGDVENIYDVGFWAAMEDVWRGWSSRGVRVDG